MIKCCIFDLDGTLLNTLPTIAFFVNKTLQKYNLPPIEEELIATFVGHGARHLITSAVKHSGASLDIVPEALSYFGEEYNKDSLYLTEAYPDIPKLVRALINENITLAVLSNKFDSSVREVMKQFMPGAFAVVRGTLDGTPIKPEPTALLTLIAELGFLPSEVAYIGDTDVDVKVARAAGVGLSVGVSWGFRAPADLVGADIIVDNPIEIYREVKNKNA